ncbi:hypothetical protein, partial [Lichenifustis flavocetrariae]
MTAHVGRLGHGGGEPSGLLRRLLSHERRQASAGEATEHSQQTQMLPLKNVTIQGPKLWGEAIEPHQFAQARTR